VRVTEVDKNCTKVIYIVLQTSVRVFYISSQKKSFLTTLNDENKFWSSYETWGTGEMKLMMKFYLWCDSFPELWNFTFSRVPMVNFIDVISAIIYMFGF